ncbi:MAG: hypothetical protein ACPGUC_01450, partial [Gammaproteobacteria bacterium]
VHFLGNGNYHDGSGGNGSGPWVTGDIYVIQGTATIPSGQTLTLDGPRQMADAMGHALRRFNNWHEARQFYEMGPTAAARDLSGPWDTGGWNSVVPSPTNGLEGVWKATSGETILIKGGRFRILTMGSQRDGIYMTYADRMIAYFPAEDSVRLFQFLLRGDRLLVQDDSGGILALSRKSGSNPLVH